MTPSNMAILVVSYNDDSRAALVSSLSEHHVTAVACATFLEAETRALNGFHNGLLVDLPSIIKAKGEEKIVAYTLTNFFPTLRVRAIGASVVPMAMPGSATQDKSLIEFITSTCPGFPPRRPRAHKRHTICILTLLRYRGEELRGFTLDVSWGGLFVVDVHPEKYSIGENVEIHLPELDITFQAVVCWVMPWGGHSAPGIGVRFTEMDQTLETTLAGILKTRKEFDRDRLVA
ncbi:MAG: PilZ domain-containing protein [Desulfuromonadales bacterium]|nr:PilZ domain-containing protein [Desulfuromonadales bacterium]